MQAHDTLRLAATLLCAAAALALGAGSARAAAGDSGPDVPAEFVQGNQTCADLMPDIPGIREFKIGYPGSGVFADGEYADFTLTLHNTSLGQTIDWAISGGRVQGVFVKGGPDGNLYDYYSHDVLVYFDDGLHAPTNPQNHKYYGLSHISFCYIPGVPKLSIGKACDTATEGNPSLNPATNLMTSRYRVPLANVGVGTAYDVMLEEGAVFGDALLDRPGSQCRLVAGATSGIALPALLIDGSDNVPIPVKVADSLAQGAQLNLVVECDSSRNPLVNSVKAYARTQAGASTYDVVPATHITDSQEVCQLAIKTAMQVGKRCRTVSMTGGVTPRVCVAISVTNASGQQLRVAAFGDHETLGQSVDLLAELIAANGGSDVLQAAGSTGDSVTVERCYTPTDNGLGSQVPHAVLYSDQASAAGVGVFDGAATGTVDSNTLSCPLCPPQPE